MFCSKITTHVMYVSVFDFYKTYMYTYTCIKVMETKEKKEKIYLLHVIISSADTMCLI